MKASVIVFSISLLVFSALAAVDLGTDPCVEYWGDPGRRNCAKCTDGLLLAYSKRGTYCAELDDNKLCDLTAYEKRYKYPPNNPTPHYLYSGPKMNLTDAKVEQSVEFCWAIDFINVEECESVTEFGYPDLWDSRDRIIGCSECNHTESYPSLRFDEKMQFHVLDCITKLNVTEVDKNGLSLNNSAEGEGCDVLGEIKMLVQESPIDEPEL